ncbi:SH3 domain and tetratricopeptide repeat-containing protein 2 isoform X2 [Gopherus flavomarginatus]|uniref:SH3 domain and tetratricopeptide repeat-containing protein 2 isoform X2 n=1 Tax=Gopherus flavomarginatus TaxID=286002 RepID=UPI0021CC2DDD|nr:SH3 domain and tetratricopeptide repeat-containing protein 2 isoform X2 [Gopherus flavomarginatus]
MGCCFGAPLQRDLSLWCTGEEPDSCSPTSAVLLPTWSSLQNYTAEPQEKCFLEETMASGNPRQLDPGDQPAQVAESPLETESVSLAVGEGFPTEVVLAFSVESRASRCVNSQLQEAARKKLWALENDDKDVSDLFKELSARLVCIQAQKDQFLLTFKTIEEIWKFSTYLALGYVACCLEHLLFDHGYWLNCSLVEDTEIRITVDEDHLATMYLGLLLQEGHFFSRAVLNVLQPMEEGEESLKLIENELVHVKDIGKESKWEGMSLSTGQRGLVAVAAIQPLSHPFYQWFLKNNPMSCGISKEISGSTSQPIGKGHCTATEDHRGRGWDELSFSKGDSIDIVGFLIPGLQWFVGKSTSSGTIGFVQSKHIAADTCEPLGKCSVFLSEEEKSFLLLLPGNGSEQHYASLLEDLARTDITSVYRFAGFEPTATFSGGPSEAALQGCKDVQLFKTFGEAVADGLSTPSNSEQSSPEGEASPTSLEEFLLREPYDLDDPKFFIDLNARHMEDSEVFDPIMTFLNQGCYVAPFQSLYDLSFSFLRSTFYGFSDEEKLVLYLETSRNCAKRTHLGWAHIRLCFLLGRMCIKRVKFSQARVYFEEAMSVMDKGFDDLPLLAALHVNLAAIYLKQKMRHKFSSMLGKAVALLTCLPGHCFSSENELEVVKYVLREAIIVGNAPLEARACFLVVKLFLQLGKYDEVLPFVERLQFLSTCFSSQDSSATCLDTTPILSYLYDKKYLPHITLASTRLFVPSGIKGASTPIWRAGLVLQNTSKLLGSQLGRSSIPAIACLYLRHALTFSHESGAVSMQKTLCSVLSKMYLQHGMLDGALYYSARAVALGRLMSEEEAFESSLSLGWMYVLASQPAKAREIMLRLLPSLRETDSVTQDGAVHNLLAVALKEEGQVKKAAENYLWALNKAKETGNRRNQAIALANLGHLTLSCRATQLAESYFLQSVQLYFELQGGEDAEIELVQVLLWLAQAMVSRHRIEDSKLCYEVALVFALKSHNVKSQLHITESLCHFYSKVSPNLGACITYHEHWVFLAQQLRDREIEGKVLQTLSQLYQTLGMPKSLRRSLDCTKQSLRIFIDLGETAKAAQAWLQAGRLYYLLQEDELVEMYFQAAIQTALKPGELFLAMDLYEEAGDIFFNGNRNRHQAMEYYRGGAVPLARKLKATRTELRLLNKLAELHIGLQGYERALEFATLAARLSSSVGDQLQELVAFHRLATVYYFLQMYEMAEDCYLKTLALCSPVLQCAEEAMYYSKVYCRLGNLTLHKLKDEHDAAAYFLLALAAATELGDQKLQGAIHAKLALIYNAPLWHKGPDWCATYRAKWLSEGGHVI